jgi:nitrite reductase (NADH) large subunit
MNTKEKQKVVVIGNGMVGHQFIEYLLASDNADDYEITTFSEEPRLAYDRVHLSTYFSGSTAADLALTEREHYRNKGVNFILDDKVVDINKSEKWIITQSGRLKSYDKLVLATGSYPFVPPVPGNDQEHCHVYRTIEDLQKIKVSGGQSKVGVVLGGGLLGLEAAYAIKGMGLETHVVEFAPKLMSVQLDDGGSKLLRDKIERLGVNVHTQKSTLGISDGKRYRYRLSFTDDSHLETDMIIFSAGIRPQDELAKKCEINLGHRGGIAIDDHCQTSEKNIYAIGECAVWEGRIFGLVAPGYQMAKVAVSQITGGQAKFKGSDMSTKLKLLGVDVASIGDSIARTPGALTYSYSDISGDIYKSLVVSEDGKTLLGAVLVGDVDDYENFLKIVLNRNELPENPQEMILPGTKSDGTFVDDFADTDTICYCNDVCKLVITSAVRNGATTLAQIKIQTLASTGCGGCTDLVQQLLDSELNKLGAAVIKDVGQLSPDSLQELVDDLAE